MSKRHTSNMKIISKRSQTESNLLRGMPSHGWICYVCGAENGRSKGRKVDDECLNCNSKEVASEKRAVEFTIVENASMADRPVAMRRVRAERVWVSASDGSLAEISVSDVAHPVELVSKASQEKGGMRLFQISVVEGTDLVVTFAENGMISLWNCIDNTMERFLDTAQSGKLTAGLVILLKRAPERQNASASSVASPSQSSNKSTRKAGPGPGPGSFRRRATAMALTTKVQKEEGENIMSRMRLWTGDMQGEMYVWSPLESTPLHHGDISPAVVCFYSVPKYNEVYVNIYRHTSL